MIVDFYPKGNRCKDMLSESFFLFLENDKNKYFFITLFLLYEEVEASLSPVHDDEIVKHYVIIRLLEIIKNVYEDGLVLVLDSLYEAPDFAFLSPIILAIKKDYDKIKIVHVTSGLDADSFLYKSCSFPYSFFDKRLLNINFSETVDRHFVCFNRALKGHRIKLVDELVNRNLQHYGIYTLATLPQSQRVFNNIKKLNLKNPSIIPTYYDGVVTSDRNQQWNGNFDVLQSALINIVTETSYEATIDIDLKHSFNQYHYKNIVLFPLLNKGWNNYLLTEKTVKPFLIGQIPLLLGPKGYVRFVQDLGFDVFDDIVDISYDKLDPVERIDGLLNSLEKLILNIPITYINDFRNSILDRLQKNREHAIKLMDQNFQLSFFEVIFRDIIKHL